MKNIKNQINVRVCELLCKHENRRLLPIAISARHIHLSQADFVQLFGEESPLEIQKELSQPGQFASTSFLCLQGAKGCFERVRILGPVRSETQVEVSASDCRALGIDAVLRLSGDLLEGSPGGSLVSEKAKVSLSCGIIVAKRHIHLSMAQAELYQLKDRQIVAVRTQGERTLIFDDVIVRVADNYQMELHLDTDEANAAMLSDGDFVEIVER